MSIDQGEIHAHYPYTASHAVSPFVLFSDRMERVGGIIFLEDKLFKLI